MKRNQSSIYNYNSFSNGKFNEHSKQKILIAHKQNNSRSRSPRNNSKHYQKEPFAVASKHKTNFGYVYSAGGIPCRVDFGTKMKLKWTIPLSELNYDPILEICFEGLLETEHPYKFVCRECIREMLLADNAVEKIIPLLQKIFIHLRNALQNDIEYIFLSAMDILGALSSLLKEEINKYLFLVLQPINKRSFKHKYREKVFNLLRDLELNGGKDAYYAIKNKIPSYNSVV